MKKVQFYLQLFGLSMLLSCGTNAQTRTYETVPGVDDDKDRIVNYNGKQIANSNNLKLSTAFSNDYFTTANRQGSFYTELKASELQNDNIKKAPLNIAIVIDRSGSMSGEKINQAKASAKYIINQLSEDDYVSIVSYDNNVTVNMNATKAFNKSAIKKAIDNITEGGNTNLCGGAIEGYNQVRKNYNSQYINRVLLMSDGLANEGITNPQQIEKIVRNQMQENGITISTFGLGRDYNEDLMTAMAENGMGNYYFIDNANDIASIFQKELNGLMQVVAKNVILKITVPEYVNIEKVYGGKYEQTGRIVTVHLRDVFSNEKKAILIKYNINNNINSTVNFATALSFTTPNGQTPKSISVNNKQEFTTNEMAYNKHFNEWVQAQEVLYQSNDRLETAMKEIDNGNYDKAKKIVEDNKVYIKKNEALIQAAPELQRAMDNNADYQTSISNVEALDESSKKVMQKASKSINYSIRNSK
jgi:Ca-activated chloride channel homolog